MKLRLRFYWALFFCLGPCFSWPVIVLAHGIFTFYHIVMYDRLFGLLGFTLLSRLKLFSARDQDFGCVSGATSYSIVREEHLYLKLYIKYGRYLRRSVILVLNLIRLVLDPGQL